MLTQRNCCSYHQFYGRKIGQINENPQIWYQIIQSTKEFVFYINENKSYIFNSVD